MKYKYLTGKHYLINKNSADIVNEKKYIPSICEF